MVETFIQLFTIIAAIINLLAKKYYFRIKVKVNSIIIMAFAINQINFFIETLSLKNNINFKQINIFKIFNSLNIFMCLSILLFYQYYYFNSFNKLLTFNYDKFNLNI